MQQGLPASDQKELARSIAQVMLQEFNKHYHYRIFREACQAGKRHFETGNWQATQQRIAADEMQDIFPYTEALRFCNLFGTR